jgi:hypothetical protein
MTGRFTLLLCTFLLLLPVVHSKSSGSKKVDSPPPPPPVASPPSPAPPPPCQSVTSDVKYNRERSRACYDPDPCVVLVNPSANTTASCLAWSPMAYWDGANCVGACELLGGEATSATSCLIETELSLLLVPILCGTWLGERDSAWSKSRYKSECVQILENRWDTGPAITSACNATRYTLGCTMPETNPTPVPLCRNSTLGTCGVATPCRSNEKCPGIVVSFLKVSELMYSPMGVHNCGWFFARDFLTVICLILVLVGTAGNPGLMIFLWGLCFVWEFVLAFGLIVCCVVGVLQGLGRMPVPTKEQGEVGAQKDSTSGGDATTSNAKGMQSRYEQVSGVRIEASDAFFLRSKC